MAESQVGLNEAILEVEHAGKWSMTDEKTGEFREGVSVAGWGGTVTIPVNTPGIDKVQKGQRFKLLVRLGFRKTGLKIAEAKVVG